MVSSLGLGPHFRSYLPLDAQVRDAGGITVAGLMNNEPEQHPAGHREWVCPTNVNNCWNISGRKAPPLFPHSVCACA